MESDETWRDVTLRLAWAAGLFDGEGCTATTVSVGRPGTVRIYVSVGQQSGSSEIVPSVLTRFQQAVGGLGYIGAPYLDQRSGTFAHKWRAESFVEAQAVIALLWSNLGAVKRWQAAGAFKRFSLSVRDKSPAIQDSISSQTVSSFSTRPGGLGG
jgi:hypothetical protein